MLQLCCLSLWKLDSRQWAVWLLASSDRCWSSQPAARMPPPPASCSACWDVPAALASQSKQTPSLWWRAAGRTPRSRRASPSSGCWRGREGITVTAQTSTDVFTLIVCLLWISWRVDGLGVFPPCVVWFHTSKMSSEPKSINQNKQFWCENSLRKGVLCLTQFKKTQGNLKKGS